jgi:hypothetical protein
VEQQDTFMRLRQEETETQIEQSKDKLQEPRLVPPWVVEAGEELTTGC